MHDYLISTTPPGGVLVDLSSHGGLVCKGRIGVVGVRNGHLAFAYLHDGEELTLGRFSPKCPPSRAGSVLQVERDEQQNQYSLLVTGRLPLEDILQGSVIIITHGDGTTHGYLIESVEERREHSLVRLQDDPGFAIAGAVTQFIFHHTRPSRGRTPTASTIQ